MFETMRWSTPTGTRAAIAWGMLVQLERGSLAFGPEGQVYLSEQGRNRILVLRRQ